MNNQVFPFKEREDYALSAWINDILNIIKRRAWLAKKEDAFLLFVENSAEFIGDYCDGLSPMESYLEFEGEE